MRKLLASDWEVKVQAHLQGGQLHSERFNKLFDLSFWGVYPDYNQKRKTYEENEYKSENILVNIFIFWNNVFA
jgi:hypothetical protein